MITNEKNFILDISSSEMLDFLWIPEGCFEMGYQENYPNYNHYSYRKSFEATIETGFWLARYPLTTGQWNAIFNEPENKNNGIDVEYQNKLSWHDAMKYCAFLNRKYREILPKDYYFSLPTDMQWEYACRAGDNSYFYKNANVTLERTLREGLVGTKEHWIKEPNNWGLYDMYNIFQWCYDYVDRVLLSAQIYRSNINTAKVLRGQSSAFKIYDLMHRQSYGARICLRRQINGLTSPKIIKNKWGEIETQELEKYKDVKCFPCGSRPWDWNETGTKHIPGILLEDVQELLDWGSEFIVLSQGVHRKLQTNEITISFLREKGIPYFVGETSMAIKHYNQVIEKGMAVGGLFHSTC